MNENLKRAVEGYSHVSDTRSDDFKYWVRDNGLDISTYDNIRDIENFFRFASKIGSDDKYVTDRFLIRMCSRVNEESYFISLFLKYDVKEIVVTTEANISVVTSLLAHGYTVEPIDLDLTDKWGKDNYHCRQNILDYGHCLLLKKN